ncbi:PREDICTED: galectin-1 isoform X2 [Capra hircus]|uniref:galectin-1 isoform X2 n=1 Tax=Capra hircus TaxID=9925 RepID=UPI000847B4A9|nr:PREDICTED: galectin-1 isoform X2 [Capra hircus]
MTGEGGLHSDWSSLLQNWLQNSISSASCGPHPIPELQLAHHPGGGTHRGLVHLKGWERPKAHFSCRVFRQLVPKLQEHPSLFNHGLWSGRQQPESQTWGVPQSAGRGGRRRQEVCVSFNETDLTIKLPDGYEFKFPNRLNLEAINYLAAGGDFKIKCVAFE